MIQSKFTTGPVTTAMYNEVIIYLSWPVMYIHVKILHIAQIKVFCLEIEIHVYIVI